MLAHSFAGVVLLGVYFTKAGGKFWPWFKFGTAIFHRVLLAADVTLPPVPSNCTDADDTKIFTRSGMCNNQ
jgi:hypothetical protein